jgi:hypothetical protein
MSFPLLLLGAILVLCGLFGLFDDEKHWKKLVLACLIDAIGARACPMVASSGF